MSNIHFAFFVNVTPLSLEALDGFMLPKPHPFNTAQTLRATRDRWAPGFKAGPNQKSGGYNSEESK